MAVHVKQLGTAISKMLDLKSRHGDDLTENNFPEYLKVQEFPPVITAKKLAGAEANPAKVPRPLSPSKGSKGILAGLSAGIMVQKSKKAKHETNTTQKN